MTTRAALTFDIEFDINGAFAAPGVRRPRGLESLLGGDHNRQIGLMSALKILKHHQMPATFFIETAQTAYFGLDEMAPAVQMIAEHGHEFQLHIHPVWSMFRRSGWEQEVIERPPRSNQHDAFPAQPPAKARELLHEGFEAFAHWGLDRPTAIRTGSLFIEPNAYEHFATHKLSISSSIGLGLNVPADPMLHRYQGATEINDVLELPVTSYLGSDVRGREKTRLATIIGMGLTEQRALLAAASSQHVPFLMVLSHASEFYFYDENAGYRRNRLTEKKLAQYCDIITQSPDFAPCTVSELQDQKKSDGEYHDEVLRVPLLKSALRYVENLLYR